LFRKGRTKFIASATQEESIPKSEIPEVCFAGRSNVGKSSLLNTISNSGKARVSERPGLTKSLNFFAMSDFLTLVDLPGFKKFKFDIKRVNPFGI
jgi:GTP-binding protein